MSKIKWEKLSLPMIDNQDNPLWKGRFSEEEIADIKKVQGSYWFSALYQQNPVQEENAYFKNKYFQYYHEDSQVIYTKNKNYLKSELASFCVCDVAFTKSKKSDFSVLLHFYQSSDNKIFISDILRGKFDSQELKNSIENFYDKHNPVQFGIETVAGQLSIFEDLIRSGKAFKKIQTTIKKEIRASQIATRIENSQVYFKAKTSWLEDFELELINFPNGKHDDQVDCLSFTNEFKSIGFTSFPKGVKLMPKFKI